MFVKQNTEPVSEGFSSDHSTALQYCSGIELLKQFEPATHPNDKRPTSAPLKRERMILVRTAPGRTVCDRGAHRPLGHNWRASSLQPALPNETNTTLGPCAK